MLEFNDKVAVVTGATSGIGLAAAELLASRGATVIGLGLDPTLDGGIDAIEQSWSARGWAAHLEVVDVTDEEQVSRQVSGVADQFGGLDIVVGAAGVQHYGSVTETTGEVWDEVFAVNVRGFFFLTKSAIPYLRARGGGSIVAVSSVQSFATQTGVAAYTASKGALNALVRSIAIDESSNGIRANTVCPASVNTPMLEHSARLFSDGSDAGANRLIDQWGRSHPLGRVARPSEIAEAIAFLAGSRSSFITGVALPVDGGILAALPVVLP